MITFSIAIVLLILGYLVYGAIVEKIFGTDKDRKTPCYTCADGVDYIPMKTWKVYLIQFLNIAGTGPIFGAIQGILFGPAAYLWIVFGCIFGGAVHDFLSGMISMRENGASLPELVGKELGDKVRFVMRLFSLGLMIMVGAVFVTTPAGLLSSMTADWGFFVKGGRISKTAGVFGGIFINSGSMPEITEAFANHHPKDNLPLFPMLFITIACGAVSGFHATQSPMMARCLKNEKHGRRVFYGAMITEGIVALIWAAAAIKFADSLNVEGDTPYQKLLAIMAPEGKMNPAIVVNSICQTWLGPVGAVLAILGVVAAPVTSGDTAFRSARLITADFLHFDQSTIVKRLMLCVPIFVISGILMSINFDILWRYFAWANQTLSIFTFWAITVWLARRKKCFYITLIPALFMTMVCTAYITIDNNGLGLPQNIGYIIATAVTALLLGLFIYHYRKGLSTEGLK